MHLRCKFGVEMGRYIENIDIAFRYPYIVSYRIALFNIENFDMSKISIYGLFRYIDSKSAKVAVMIKRYTFSILFNNLNSMIKVTVLHIINLMFLLLI